MSLGTGVGAERNLLDETPEHAHQLVMDQPILRNHELETLRQVAHDDLPRAHDRHHLAGRRRARRACSARLAEVCDEAHDALAGRRQRPHPVRPPRSAPSARRSRRCWPSPPCTTTSCARARACARASSSSPASRARCTTSRRSSATAPARSTRTCCSTRSTSSSPRAASPASTDADDAERNVVKAHRQGPAQDDLQDGDLDDPVLLRRADLRGRRPGEGRSSTATSPAPRRASAASASTSSRARRSTATPAACPARHDDLLPVGGVYAWRRDGEHHMWNPETIALLQHAVRDRRTGDAQEKYDEYAAHGQRGRRAPRDAARPADASATDRRAGAARGGRAGRRRSSSASPPARCRSARSPRRRTRRSRSR